MRVEAQSVQEKKGNKKDLTFIITACYNIICGNFSCRRKGLGKYEMLS